MPLHVAPAGLEKFYREQAEPAEVLLVPPLPAGPNDGCLPSLARCFGLTFE